MNISREMMSPFGVTFYGIADVVKMTGWSEKTVKKLFNDPKFPSANYGKRTLIEENALINFFSTRHDKNDELYWRV